MMLKESQVVVTFIARNDSNALILIIYTYVHMEFGSFQALIVTDTVEGTVMIRFLTTMSRFMKINVVITSRIKTVT